MKRKALAVTRVSKAPAMGRLELTTFAVSTLSPYGGVRPARDRHPAMGPNRPTDPARDVGADELTCFAVAVVD